MTDNATYLVIISRTAEGYTAYAPAFPTIYVTAKTARTAYARFKPLLKEHIQSLIAAGYPLPRDPVFQTRTLRLDLRQLRENEELR